MYVVYILLVLVLVTIGIGIKSGARRLCALTASKLLSQGSNSECQHSGQWQKVILTAFVGSFLALAVVHFGFSDISWKYKVALAMPIGFFTGSLIGIAIFGRRGANNRSDKAEE